MLIRDEITRLLSETLAGLSLMVDKIHLEHPENIDFGDYSTNLAMALAKIAKENPRMLAEKIIATASSLLTTEKFTELSVLIEKIDLAGAGFINFTLSPLFFRRELENVLTQGLDYGKSDNLLDKQIVVEYTNTNVLKPFHIGHLMGNALGESLVRIWEKAGAKIVRCTYEGDVGLHIAKTLWGILHLNEAMPDENETLTKKMDFIGRAYAFGSEQYEGNEEATREIKEINKEVYDRSNDELIEIYQTARDWSLQHFEEIYKVLGTKFDHYFFESEVTKSAIEIIQENLKQGIFVESEGAIIYQADGKTNAKGQKLHTRVFVNSQGLPTYEAKEIAHAIQKYMEYPADRSIIITANEQNDYFKVVLEALREVVPHIAGTTEHLSHGMMRLTEGKMSSRKGNVITGESLIMDTVERVKEVMNGRDLTEMEKDEIAEKVAVAAIKFTILCQTPGSDIIFDREKAISFDGDSGPYLQYTLVRARSVLAKADGVMTGEGESGGGRFDLDGLSDKIAVYPIEKILYRFPEVIDRCGQEKTVHYLVNYAVSLSAAFNNFYAHNKILDEDEQNKDQTMYRLAIVSATANILESALRLLGIKAPSKM